MIVFRSTLLTSPPKSLKLASLFTAMDSSQLTVGISAQTSYERLDMRLLMSLAFFWEQLYINWSSITFSKFFEAWKSSAIQNVDFHAHEWFTVQIWHQLCSKVAWYFPQLGRLAIENQSKE